MNRSTGRTLLVLALGALVLSSAGCRIPIGVKESWETGGPPLDREINWAEKKVFFRSFGHSAITAQHTAVATGPGGTAVATGRTVSTMETVPQWMLSLAQMTLPFKSVTPISAGKEPDYILQGYVNGPGGWRGWWWTWAQLIFLWTPGWFLPTHGVYFDYTFELDLYDLEFNLIQKWRVTLERRYLEWIWASMAGVERSFAYQNELVNEVMRAVGDHLRGGEFRAPAR